MTRRIDGTQRSGQKLLLIERGNDDGDFHTFNTIFPASVLFLPTVLSSCKRCAPAVCDSGSTRSIFARNLPSCIQRLISSAHARCSPAGALNMAKPCSAQSFT